MSDERVERRQAAVPSADEANIEPILPDMAARTELHSIDTLTLSDTQFLRGEAVGKATTTSGQLRLATNSGQLPVVVLQHGSAGMAPNVEMWVRELNKIGVSTFALDGFTGRGLIEVNTNQALLGRLNFILDIYRALEVLAKHPRVDPARIALMGFSRGGQATLYASLKRFHRLWNRSGVELAAYVSFYPDCATKFLSDTDVVGRPIRIFGGTPDNYNPIAACKAYVERLRAAGADVQLTEYPNASHAFDNPLGAQPAAMQPAYQSVRNCLIEEDADGLLINTDTKRPFAYTDTCVVHGVHIGHDPVATREAKQAIKAIFKKAFQLP
ncbi:dienelactone hydrolase [Bradyrhizobium sp. USDA 4524]|uniref:dienelactone hydrolase family protein n=1 Tax=unclassified Bradyrhizobium TaxID=2631580 RepID=UPI00209C82BD|nr:MULTISPECIES: dienelactone hydrolase family protein [unclassified Bradyrhizobium]MCP1843448.1 dienelactone hydrolase [Bradyrhizobium sp. USDA 4538]MCP1904014.1 dienelactone hydrolase [Bradyrhizobium sp. USDA 4537]MCP1990330.1 dienelactone hydrolase [Bradyrhizobium sp. USDA 4539]